VGIPDYETLMLPVLQEAARGDIHVREAVARISDVFGLTDEERAQRIPSGTAGLMSNRVHWAKTYLKQAGLIDQPRRGWMRVTPRGIELLGQAPARIDNSVLNRYPEFVAFRKRRREVEADEGAVFDDREVPQLVSAEERSMRPAIAVPPEERIQSAAAELVSTLAAELLERLRGLDPTAFERLVIEVLLAMGYGGSRREAARAIGRSGDDGVDGVIDGDVLGLDRVYVQAKRYAEGNSVGPAAIREFFGSLNLKRASKGLFVTTASFSSAARSTADQLGSRIVLVDGEQLAELMIRFRVGCRVVETVELKRIDEDFFEDLES